MKIDKEYILKNKKSITILIYAIGIIASVIYLRAFFQSGIIYYGHFLQESTITSDSPSREYNGVFEKGPIKLKLTGLNQTDKLLELKAGNTMKEYVFDGGNSGENLRLFDSSNFLIYEGIHDSTLGMIKEEGNEAISLEKYKPLRVNGYNEENPEPLLLLVTALKLNTVIRGRINILLLAGLIFLMAIIDTRFPKFFYKLIKIDFKQDIKVPEAYLMIQKITWSITPVILFYLLYKALR
ncbi:MAG: hypothetical protein WBI17_06125 [Clostridiaceae bacterium]